MDKGDIDRFLAQLTPAQETLVILREISAKLSVLIEIARPTLTLTPTVAAEARGMDGKKRR